MKKLVTAIVVGVTMTIMSVVPCFAGIDFACEDAIGLTASFGDTSESYDTPSTDVTVQTTTPTVTTPATTAVATDASLAQQAQLIATNYVVTTFYNGDINAASADMNNFMSYYNACYPNILQGLQQK